MSERKGKMYLYTNDTAKRNEMKRTETEHIVLCLIKLDVCAEKCQVVWLGANTELKQRNIAILHVHRTEH